MRELCLTFSSVSLATPPKRVILQIKMARRREGYTAAKRAVFAAYLRVLAAYFGGRLSSGKRRTRSGKTRSIKIGPPFFHLLKA